MSKSSVLEDEVSSYPPKTAGREVDFSRISVTVGGEDAGAKAGLSWRKQDWEEQWKEGGAVAIEFLPSGNWREIHRLGHKTDRKTVLWELGVALALCSLREALSLSGSLETAPRATGALQTLLAMWVKPASCVLRAGLHWWQLGGADTQAERKCQKLASSLRVVRHGNYSWSQWERALPLSLKLELWTFCLLGLVKWSWLMAF